MDFILKLIASMVKHSGHAKQLVSALAQHLSAEHLQEMIDLFQSSLAAFSPQDAVVAAPIEAAVENLVTKVEAGSMPLTLIAPVAESPVDEAVPFSDVPVSTMTPAATAIDRKSWKPPVKKS